MVGLFRCQSEKEKDKSPTSYVFFSLITVVFFSKPLVEKAHDFLVSGYMYGQGTKPIAGYGSFGSEKRMEICV